MKTAISPVPNVTINTKEAAPLELLMQETFKCKCGCGFSYTMRSKGNCIPCDRPLSESKPTPAGERN